MTDLLPTSLLETAVTTREIYCCGCEQKITARLTNGGEVYPHRPDLHNLPFWRCDQCKLHVGCHHKTDDRTRPLGIIPTKELSAARSHIHALLDPLWETGRFQRKALYADLSKRLGWKYHTAKIRTVDEARQVYRTIREIARG